MNNRIKEKIDEIEQFLEELENSLPKDFDEYKTDYKLRAIGERYFEKIIEGVIDLAFFIIKEKNSKEILKAVLNYNKIKIINKRINRFDWENIKKEYSEVLEND